jgi:hypothetical protein
MQTTKATFWKLFALAMALCVLVGTQLTSAAFPASGAIYYVSKTGNNANGTSWATAWNELDQINWSVIQPGDTILIDGGSSQMVYASTLTVGKSGGPGAPITIRMASDAGRNGKVVIFGGRSTPLPDCRTPNYTLMPARNKGIDMGGSSWIVIEGTKWSGITVYGHNQYGIALSSSSGNDTFRNVEIYDNGRAWFNTAANAWDPDLPGVNLSGSNNTFEQVIIHDNGQDAFQSGGGVSNVTIRRSWLYNGRAHAAYPAGDTPWNYCRHSDGIQIYSGGAQSGVTIDQSIFGPGFLQGTLLGQATAAQGQYAQINNLTVSNSLFIKGSNANIMGYASTNSQNWKIDQVTSYGAGNHAIFIDGTNHTISNNIIYEGRNSITASNVTYSGNCQYQLASGTFNGITADPQWVAPPVGNPATLQSLIKADYGVKSSSPCAGKGSSITSVAQLLGQSSVPQPPAPQPTQVPPAPSPTAVPQPTQVSPTPSQVFTWEPEAGAISTPFTASNGSISQSVETTDPAQGGRAACRFSIPTPGNYIVKALISAPDSASNSIFINIDGEPSAPTMVWDVAITSGFQEQAASWRGTGTPTANQFAPKLFTLAAGDHELVIRGREHNLRIDRIVVAPV